MAHSFCALSLLISASLLARLWAKYSENSIQLCELLERNSSDARCYQLIIGVVSIGQKCERKNLLSMLC